MTPFPLLVCGGAPRERGVAHGAQASRQIARSLAFYSRAWESGSGVSFGVVCDQLALKLPAWRAAAPELIAEIEGIAEGSGYATLEILALNARGSFTRPPQEQLGQADSQTTEVLPEEGCTSFVALPEATRSGHTLVGQNWDYLSGIQESVVLLHIRPQQGPTLLMIVEAGTVGRHGVTSMGLAFHANGLTPRLKDETALPSPFLRRRVMEAPDLCTALNRAVTPPRPGSTNFLLAHRDAFAVSLETQPHTVRWVYPERGVLAHANHYQAEIPFELTATYTPSGDSLLRLDRATRLLRTAADGAGVTLETLTSLCRDHVGGRRALCSHADPADPFYKQWATVATVITDLDEGVMSVAAGPPCCHQYAHIQVDSGRVCGTEPATVAGRPH